MSAISSINTPLTAIILNFHILNICKKCPKIWLEHFLGMFHALQLRNKLWKFFTMGVNGGVYARHMRHFGNEYWFVNKSQLDPWHYDCHINLDIQDILGMNADLRINHNWIPDTMTVILISWMFYRLIVSFHAWNIRVGVLKPKNL